MIRVIGVGDNFVDRYIDKNTMYPGGNSVNFAVYAKQLGYRSAYLGVLAADREAGMITDALEAYGIDYSRCPVVSDGETGKGSIRLVDGDRIISDDNDNGSVKHTPLVLDRKLLDYIAGFDVIHSSYFAFMEDKLEQLASTHVPVAYDFADNWDEKQIDKLCPHIDIALFSGGHLTEADLKDKLLAACDRGCEIAIGTMGAAGAIVFDGEIYTSLLPYNQGNPIVDTMGAGDSFFTGFVTAYIDGKVRFSRLFGPDLDICTTAEDQKQYRRRLVRLSMEMGNAMAMKTCMTEGSFGRGETIKGSSIK